MRRYRFITFVALLFVAVTPISARQETAADWKQQVEQWRTAREADLLKEDGYLAIAGLSFLKPGANIVGSNPSSDVVLPAGRAPGRAGRITVQAQDVVRFEPEAGVAVTLNGKPAAGTIQLREADAQGGTPADRLGIGRLTLHLHRSGDRLALRLRDPESPSRRSFSGLRWFPLDEQWRIAGRFIKYDTPRQVQIQNILGDVETVASPGELEVTLEGTTVRLVALAASRGRLWLVFSDASSPELTYRIRFLYTDPPDAQGRVVADFNRAYNPPCAYNPFTTCPLPPRQNRLSVAIRAGERNYPGKKHPTATVQGAR